MVGLVPAMHAFFLEALQDVDGRHKVYHRAAFRADPLAGHDN
jgi:hypothetical protein